MAIPRGVDSNYYSFESRLKAAFYKAISFIK